MFRKKNNSQSIAECVEKLVTETVSSLNTCYEEKIESKEDAAKTVDSILQHILSIESTLSLDKILKLYPESIESITLLVKLRFEDTALNYKTRIDVSDDNQDQGQIAAQIAQAALDSLKTCKELQGILINSNAITDRLKQNTESLTKQALQYQENSKKLQEDRNQINKDIENLTNSTAQEAKAIEVLFKQLGLRSISVEDRNEWIKNSSFSADLKKVQQTIKRLDSRFVYNGRHKAKQIQDAFNSAIDAAIVAEQNNEPFKDFNQFLAYQKPTSASGLFSSQSLEPSLNDALSIQRFEAIDKLFKKTTTKSAKQFKETASSEEIKLSNSGSKVEDDPLVIEARFMKNRRNL